MYVRLLPRSVDSSHPDVAETYTNLGAICIKLHDLPQAKIFLDQALANKEPYHGTDNEALVETLLGFGNYYKHLHDNKQARAYLVRAFKIRQQYFGEGNPLTAEVKRFGRKLQVRFVFKSLHSKLAIINLAIYAT